jgi:hypothetical protein
VLELESSVRMGASNVLLRTQLRTFSFHEKLAISSEVEQLLTSQEKPGSVELILSSPLQVPRYVIC